MTPTYAHASLSFDDLVQKARNECPHKPKCFSVTCSDLTTVIQAKVDNFEKLKDWLSSAQGNSKYSGEKLVLK